MLNTGSRNEKKNTTGRLENLLLSHEAVVPAIHMEEFGAVNSHRRREWAAESSVLSPVS